MAERTSADKPLVPRAMPREGREIAERLEAFLSDLSEEVAEKIFPLFPRSTGENQQEMRASGKQMIREKLFDYFKRRLDQQDIAAIRLAHKELTRGLSISNPTERDNLQKLELDRQAKITEIIRETFDVESLLDEIRIRFPEAATPRRLFRAYLDVKNMSIEQLLEAHANREFKISDDELKRLQEAPQPLPMFGGEVLATDSSGGTFTLVQLTNADHLSLEGASLQHCIADEGAGYKKDIATRLPDGTMKAAGFSLRWHRPGTDPSVDPGVSQWTIWYDRESRTVQQVKGLHNATVRRIDDAEEQAVLRALARLLTDPQLSKRYPIDHIKDLQGIKLERDVLLVVARSGEIQKKMFEDLSDNDTVISGSVALNASFLDDEIRRVVATRGLRTTISG